MLHALLFAVSFATAFEYQLAVYTGERCTGAETKLRHLPDPPACHKLNHSVTKSILMKSDNVHDDQHSVIVYEDDDCTGSILGMFENMNGCLNLRGLTNVVGRSIMVTSGTTKSDESPNEYFVADYLYNSPGRFGNQRLSPIARAFSGTGDGSSHGGAGTSDDQSSDILTTTQVDHVNGMQTSVATPVEKSASSTSTNPGQRHIIMRILFPGVEELKAVANTIMTALDNVSIYFAQGSKESFEHVLKQSLLSANPQYWQYRKLWRPLVRLIAAVKSQGLTNSRWHVRDRDGRMWEVTIRRREGDQENADNGDKL
ncbi:hypothetical protein AbraIFM66951_011996 [Aspergillus brasiliensis]|uniref:Uncharacterized protein n=1 Tax=Aspergillus brasiliensis TaxID=319629 RepID=A0A9W5YXV6_9EURO|nr:hypothetical protein AbraCBS73388_011580 [Aspergillus brasiliensis]GKZ48234.1 hypothetical protein AbraIFM66951_011996 [Aspergillus brasiliensis]